MRTALLLLSSSLAAVPATAQAPVGDLIPIAELTAGYQTRPDLAPQPNRQFVVVWQSEDADGDGSGIRGRRFSGNGVPLSGEFEVNETTTGNQWGPKVASDAAGDFVVVWNGPDGGGSGVFARLFEADGKALGPEFQVNVRSQVGAPWVELSRNGLGEFLVAWVDSDTGEILASIHDSTGGAVLPEFVVNSSGNYPAASYSDGVTGGMRSDGGFVVAWQGEHEVDGLPTTDIFQQRFDPDGTRVGGEFQVSKSGPARYFSNRPDLDVDESDNFLVVWHTQQNLEYGAEFGRRTDATGSTGAIKELGATSHDHTFSMVADGEFVVVWDDYHCCLRGGRFDPTGNLIAPFDVPFAAWPTVQTHLSADTNDFVLVGFVGDSTDRDLVGQRFGNDLFIDGFESGDTSQWTQTVP